MTLNVHPTSTPPDNSITTGMLTDESVTTAKIDDLAVTSGKLATAVSTDVSNGLKDGNLRILQGLGSDIKGLPFGSPTILGTVSLALTDGYGFFTAVYIPVASTITGARFLQFTNGDYTADNTNQVGLYSFSGVTATQVAASADNGNLWKAGANNYINANFVTPYAAAAGVYYVGVMRNSSAQVTGPTLYLCSSLGSSAGISFGTSGLKLTWNQGANTALQASYNVSAASNMSSVFWCALY